MRLVRTCTVVVPELCGRTAIEKLVVREYPWSEEQVTWRCEEHPAGDWVSIVRRAFPMAEARVERA
jgi:hypothetical protein